jgi:hypothetical protein
MTRMSRLLLIVICLLLAGCNTAGPTALNNGRGVYNAVINATEDEQILTMLVRQRYDETFGMLAVSSVTANIRLGASLNSDVGIGPDINYEGNLVPLSAGVVYEENPTISYVPLRGEQFMQRMLAPISPEQLLLLTRASTEDVEVLRLLLRRINGLDNPLYSNDVTSTQFDECMESIRTLRHTGSLDIVRTADDQFALYIQSRHDDLQPTVDALLEMLGITPRPTTDAPILLPIRFWVGAPREDGLDLETPSVLEVIRAVSRGIEIPTDHVQRGIARPDDVQPGLEAFILHVRSSRDRPTDALVAIRHRGWWFSIDSTDVHSKQQYMILRTLIGIRLDADSSTVNVPTLVVPVN